MNILFIHQTMMGSLSATGKLLTSLTYDLSKNINYFEICFDIDNMGFSSSQYNLSKLLINRDIKKRLKNILKKNKIDIVIYRPDKKIIELAPLLLELQSRYSYKIITSVMDSWFDSTDTELLNTVFTASQGIWFISDAMQTYFLSLFDISAPQYVIANGIDLQYFRFPSIIPQQKPKRLICCFFGSINEQQTYDGLSLIAKVLNEKQFKFEIYSRQYQTKLAEKLLKYPTVSLYPPIIKEYQYFAKLNSADILVIPYSWNKESVHYLKYSFGNKIPECLATGKPIIACGSPEINNINYLKSIGIAGVINEANETLAKEKLIEYTQHLYNNYTDYLRLSQSNRIKIQEEFNLKNKRQQFYQMLLDT